MKTNFVKQGKEEMNEFVIKAITDLLKVLDSRVVFPTDMYGVVQEHKLLAVVKSREQVYKSTMSLVDLIQIDNSVFLNQIIRGLKTTWHELTKITTRNIGGYSAIDDEYASVEIKEQLARESVEDDRLSSIAQAKELSAKVAFQILDRISLLEDPEGANDEILRSSQTPNIIEKYVEN